MATYKKKGSKSKHKGFDSSKKDSTTAEVFESLDVNASRTEKIVAKISKLYNWFCWFSSDCCSWIFGI